MVGHWGYGAPLGSWMTRWARVARRSEMGSRRATSASTCSVKASTLPAGASTAQLWNAGRAGLADLLPRLLTRSGSMPRAVVISSAVMVAEESAKTAF